MRNDKKWSIGRVVADTTAVHTDAKCLTWHQYSPGAQRKGSATHDQASSGRIPQECSSAYETRMYSWRVDVSGWRVSDYSHEQEPVGGPPRLPGPQSCSMTESERSCRVALSTATSRSPLSRGVLRTVSIRASLVPSLLWPVRIIRVARRGQLDPPIKRTKSRTRQPARAGSTVVISRCDLLYSLLFCPFAMTRTFCITGTFSSLSFLRFLKSLRLFFGALRFLVCLGLIREPREVPKPISVTLLLILLLVSFFTIFILGLNFRRLIPVKSGRRGLLVGVRDMFGGEWVRLDRPL
ncbi:hypothetical protein HD554DRAFT_250369 [Boletus coccyginus]|nr:hypothetical protein HD554DRAFT_250369 [Boletus coccyginus]